jgi:hypothetical protein
MPLSRMLRDEVRHGSSCQGLVRQIEFCQSLWVNERIDLGDLCGVESMGAAG